MKIVIFYKSSGLTANTKTLDIVAIGEARQRNYLFRASTILAFTAKPPDL